MPEFLRAFFRFVYMLEPPAQQREILLAQHVELLI
jgi:hypothetical protein